MFLVTRNLLIFLFCVQYETCISKIASSKFDKAQTRNQPNLVNKDYLSDVIGELSQALALRLGIIENGLKRVEESVQNISNRLNQGDCYDVKIKNPMADSGIYKFYLDSHGKRPVSVYCEMMTTGGGWTVIQQRLPENKGQKVTRTSFDRTYHEYQIGFGKPDRDYWIGLENIFLWTNSRPYELRIELSDFRMRKAYASYDFYLEDHRQGYRFHASNYQGNAGNALSGFDNFTANGMMFSTFDEDRDTSTEINCAKFWNTGGWWYNRCAWANLNAPYKPKEESKNCTGINWHKWPKHNGECLRSTRMMIRPKLT